MQPVLVVDVGNTSTSLALYRNRRVWRHTPIHGGVRTRAEALRWVRRLAGRGGVGDAVYSSVVPRADKVWVPALREALGKRPLVLTHRLNVGVAIRYPRPRTIGADRLANACAAVALYGAPVIVADFGTAVTFDVVTRDRAYVGGVIAPGLPLMVDYLAERTALLPRIALKGACPRVGRSTEGAMRIGARIGYSGMVREIVAYLTERLGEPSVRLCATGGFARWALADCGLPFAFNQDLTLYGLGLIHDLNAEKRA